MSGSFLSLSLSFIFLAHTCTHAHSNTCCCVKDEEGRGGESGDHHGQWIRYRESHAPQYFSYHMLEEAFRRFHIHPVLVCFERAPPAMFGGGAAQRGLGGGAAIISSNAEQLNGVLEIPSDMRLQLYDEHTKGLNQERLRLLRQTAHLHDRSCAQCTTM